MSNFTLKFFLKCSCYCTVEEMMRKEEIEGVIRMSPQFPFLGACQPWERKRGGQGCESLRGMGSGILLVMYYTPRALGKGVGGVQLWVCANIVTVPKRWALETTPLYLWESRLWENQIQVCRLATGRNA